MADKLIDAFSFKCSTEFKVRLAGVAAAENMDASEFARLAIEKEIEARRATYQALHQVFGNTTDDKE